MSVTASKPANAARFTERTRPLRAALLAGLAGAATLSNEALGARLLRPLVGGAAASHAGAIAGLLGGLGLGALLASGALRKGASARSLAGRALVALGAGSLVAPFMAGLAATPVARVLVATHDRAPAVATVLGALFALVATLPFGVASGAIYPAAARLHGAGAGTSTAVTGTASSLASALAALLGTFVLAPAFGVRVSLVMGAVLYGVAFALTRTFDEEKEPVEQGAKGRSLRDEVRAMTRGAEAPVAFAIALGGVASTAWQLGLSRLGVLAFGPSAFALAASSAAHVMALGLGELVAVRVVSRTKDPRRALGVALAVACVGALIAVAYLPALPAWAAARFARGVGSLFTLWASACLALVLGALPVVAPLGVALPLAARALSPEGDDGSVGNARALSAMALGNVVGALLVALWAVPSLGLPRALVACAVCLAVGVFLARTRPGAREPVLVVVGGAVLAACFAKLPARWDAAKLSEGPFLYARAPDLELGYVSRFTWGREATTVVRRDDAGGVLLQIDGKVDATSGGDAATQILVGVVPAVLARSPRNVLVVGLGSGMTVDAVRDVPGVERVTVTELVPEVIEAARDAFRTANHRVVEAPNVRTLARDAALHLRGATETYDVIVSEPSNPWVLGMADLFTVQALRAARARLAPGGVMAAWFHGYSTDAASIAGVVATFREVFPYANLLELAPGEDYLLVAFTDPEHAGVDVDRALARLQSERLRPHLERAGVSDTGSFFGRFVAGVDGVRSIARDGEIFEADDLRLEFRAPSLLYEDASTQLFALLSRAQDLPLAGLNPSGAGYTRLLEASEPSREAGLHTRQMRAFLQRDEIDRALHEGEQAVAAAPNDKALQTQLSRIYVRRAARRAARRDAAGAGEDLRLALELEAPPTERFRAHRALGDLALQLRDNRRAAQEYGRALEVAREVGAQTPELHMQMARVLTFLGDEEHARAEVERAVRECGDGARCDELRNAVDEARGRR